MPASVAMSEDWLSGVNNPLGANWRRGAPVGAVLGPLFADHIGGENPALPPNPTIVCGDTTAVQDWGQGWFVGSTTPGQGKHVQTNTLLKRRGSALHTSIASPP